MDKPTKVQHYVWRHYLAPWTKELKSNGGLYVAMKRSDGWRLLGAPSSFWLVPLMSIAFEKFFYDLSDTTDADFEAAKLLTDQYLKKIHPNSEYSSDYSLVYDNRFQRDFLEKEYISEIEKSSIKFLDRLCKGELPYKELKHYALREKLNNDIINILLNGEDTPNRDVEAKEALDEMTSGPDEKFEFYEFLALQMLRTKYAKNISDNLLATDENLKTAEFSSALHTLIIPSEVCYLATRFSRSNLHTVVLKNNTDIPFIATDNPVINLDTDYLSGIAPTQMTLYSPFAPNAALICTSSVSQDQTFTVDDSDMVFTLNQKAINACDRQIYSNDKTYLEEIVAVLNSRLKAPFSLYSNNIS